MSKIQVWSDGSNMVNRTISVSSDNRYGMFVAINDDIYFNGRPNNRVDRWFSNGTISDPAMYVYGDCYGLFINTNNTLYCSVGAFHLVVSILIDDTMNKLILVAGQGCPELAPDALNYPYAIFVDFNFSLYVADSCNNRIQMFPSGQRNGTTVAGCGASGTMNLSRPTGVVLDADGYVFIADTDNNRIVGSGPSGFRCIVGCSMIGDSASDHLNGPGSMAFDSFGNIWVADYSNGRVQKFLLDNSSCGKPLSSPFLDIDYS